MILSLAAAALPGFISTDPIGPGRYCAYDTATLVHPPGDVRTIVDVGAGPRPTVVVSVTWPHTDKVFVLEGVARAGSDGTLRFPAEDGWGNRSEVSLTGEGDLDFDVAPPPDAWAETVSIFYVSGRVGACRPEDLASPPQAD